MVRRALIVVGFVLPVSGGSVAASIVGTGKAASECYVTVEGLDSADGTRVECSDGDPACDADGAIDGGCTFAFRVCAAQALPDCVVTEITQLKVTPTKLAVPVPSVPLTEPTCGEEARVAVPLKAKGRKPGKRVLTLLARNSESPKRDKDKLRLTCLPGDGGATTSTTSPSSTTSSSSTSTSSSTTSSTIASSTSTSTSTSVSTTSTTTTSTTTSSVTTTTPPDCTLIVNGDFELPVTVSPENGWSFAATGGPNWLGTGGNPGGHFVINESGSQETDPTLFQTVTGLTAGVTYGIIGDYRSYAPSFGDPGKTDAFAVRVEPQPLDHGSVIVLGLPRPSPDPEAWTPFGVSFVASDSTVTLSFIAERDGDDSSFDVDNVCLFPVPAATGPEAD